MRLRYSFHELYYLEVTNLLLQICNEEMSTVSLDLVKCMKVYWNLYKTGRDPAWPRHTSNVKNFKKTDLIEWNEFNERKINEDNKNKRHRPLKDR